MLDLSRRERYQKIGRESRAAIFKELLCLRARNGDYPPLPFLFPVPCQLRFSRWRTYTRLIRPPRFSLQQSRPPNRRRRRGLSPPGSGFCSSSSLGSGGGRHGTRSLSRTRWEGTKCEYLRGGEKVIRVHADLVVVLVLKNRKGEAETSWVSPFFLFRPSHYTWTSLPYS